MKKGIMVSILAGAAVLLNSAVAFAAEPQIIMEGLSTMAWVALAAGLAIGLSAFGGALGQGRAAAAALEGIARNPSAAGKIFTPMIIGLALIESLVIYALVIAFILAGNVDLATYIG